MSVKKLRCFIEIKVWQVNARYPSISEWSTPYVRKFKTVGERNTWWFKNKQKMQEATASDGHPLYNVKFVER